MKRKANYLIMLFITAIITSVLGGLFYSQKIKNEQTAERLSPIVAENYANDYLATHYYWRGGAKAVFDIKPIIEQCKLPASAVSFDSVNGMVILDNNKYKVDINGIKGCYDKQIEANLNSEAQVFTSDRLQLFALFKNPKIVNNPQFLDKLKEIKADRKIYPIEFLTLTKIYVDLYDNALKAAHQNQYNAFFDNPSSAPQPTKETLPAKAKK